MHRRTNWLVVVCLLVLLSGSCRSPHGNAAGGREREDARNATRRETVKHVVVCWLKSPGDPTARRRIIDESNAFVGVIPGLLDVAAGTTLPSSRPTVETSFDVAIVMTFKDEAALRAYDEHPHHKQAVETVLRPLVERLVIYDFRRE